MRALGAAFVAATVLLGVSCTEGYVLQGRIQGLREVASQAKGQGAYRCAPVELALAEANLSFAETELAQGDQVRVEQHLKLAEVNAKAALRLSPPDQCSGEPRPGDRDGDGVPDNDDACAETPEDRDGQDDADGCPEDQDIDGDGVADSIDLCVPAPEDTDDYLDTDGCPDEDNDADGIFDVNDACPGEAEDPDGYLDADGCPDLDNDGDAVADLGDACPDEHGLVSERGCPKVYRDVVVTDSAVVITQQVHFDTNRARIRPESFGLLGTVSQALLDYPNVRVEVQGHTDDRGPDRRNLKLSQQRADAVRDYLISRGVEPYRMSARGYGETMPIDSNKTVQGRAANRRVEFKRTDEGARKGGGELGPGATNGAP